MTAKEREELGRVAWDAQTKAIPKGGWLPWEDLHESSKEVYRSIAEAVCNRIKEREGNRT